MKNLAIILAIPFLLMACLELTPKVSTEFSEIEARAVFEEEIRRMCDHKKSKIPALLAQIDAAAAEPTADHWLFNLDGAEAQVFPSGIAAGDYIREIKTAICR